MPTTLPVPLEFELPAGWQPAPPDRAGAPDVAFVALFHQPDPASGFDANITVDGAYRPDAATLEEIADESVRRMQEIAEGVAVTDRNEMGSAQAPGLTQKLSFRAVTEGHRRELVQSQVYLAVRDLDDPARRAVVRLALTAAAAQHDAVLGDFQQFVRTVRPATGTA